MSDLTRKYRAGAVIYTVVDRHFCELPDAPNATEPLDFTNMPMARPWIVVFDKVTPPTCRGDPLSSSNSESVTLMKYPSGA